MARLPGITDRNQLPADKQYAYDYLEKTRGAVRGAFSVVLNNPDVAQRVAHVGTFVRFESTLPPMARELAASATSAELDSWVETPAHTRQAGEAGASQAALDAILSKGPITGLSEAEALPIRVARSLIRDHQLSDADYSATVAAFGEKGAIELFGAIGYFAMLGALFNALEIKPA